MTAANNRRAALLIPVEDRDMEDGGGSRRPTPCQKLSVKSQTRLLEALIANRRVSQPAPSRFAPYIPWPLEMACPVVLVRALNGHKF
jgi:hypothetical protein